MPARYIGMTPVPRDEVPGPAFGIPSFSGLRKPRWQLLGDASLSHLLWTSEALISASQCGGGGRDQLYSWVGRNKSQCHHFEFLNVAPPRKMFNELSDYR